MKFRKIKLIRDIMEDMLAPYGFSIRFEGSKEVAFSRKRNTVVQYILVNIALPSSLRIFFKTNTYQYPTTSGYELLCKVRMEKDPYYSRLQNFYFGGWKWKDKKEFLEILDIFKKIIAEYGLDELERLSIHWTDARPTIETDRKLYEHHTELNMYYRKILGIEKETDTIKVINKVNQEILKIRGQNFKKVEPVLIGLAAIYGEEIINKCGGEWKWEETLDNFICCITNIHGHIYEGEYPLNAIICYWRDKRDDISVFMQIIDK